MANTIRHGSLILKASILFSNNCNNPIHRRTSLPSTTSMKTFNRRRRDSCSSLVLSLSLSFLRLLLFSYKKQSSGKDLSRRSNDELDCIFGWNKAVDQSNDLCSPSNNAEEEETKVNVDGRCLSSFIRVVVQGKSIDEQESVFDEQTIDPGLFQREIEEETSTNARVTVQRSACDSCRFTPSDELF